MVKTIFRRAIPGLVAVAITAAAAARGGPAAGEQRRWALVFRARLDQADGGKPVEIELRGDWLFTVCAVRSGEYDAELQLMDVRLRGDGVPLAPRDVQDVERRLALPFWATYGSDGALLTVHFFRDVTASDRNLLQMIATETQFVHPPEDRRVWTVLERDAAGEYLAIYNRLAPGVVIKRKLKYVHADKTGAAPGGLDIAVEQSELRYALSPEGCIAALDGSTRVRMGELLPGAGPLRATAETHLGSLRTGAAPGAIGGLARAGAQVLTLPVVTHNPDPAQARAERDRSLIEGRTTESLLQNAGGNDAAAAERLAALFRERPAAVDAAIALLRKNGPRKAVTDALGSAESPVAIAGLGALARDVSLDRKLRIDAVNAFIQMHHPGLDAMRIPPALLDDPDRQIASAARLMSGALARAGREQHSEEADRIDRALIAGYRAAPTTAQKCEFLAGLGNSAGPEAVAIIESALGDERPELRAAAARGLRLPRGAPIDALLSKTMTHDSDAAVRAAAIFACGFHHPIGTAIAEALLKAARSDAAEYVRSSAISMLRQNPQSSPAIPSTLEWIAANDASPGVRRLAREALASLSAPEAH